MAFKIHFNDDIVPPDAVRAVLDEIEKLVQGGCNPLSLIYYDMGETTGGTFNYILSSGRDADGIDTMFVERYDPETDTIVEYPNK